MVSYDTHGDVLAIKVHKPNSLEHLRPTRFQRPKTAKPKTMHPILPPGILLPGMEAPKKKARPQTAGARLVPDFGGRKSLAQKNIDGEYGPEMIGVTTYPYSRSQRQYLTDFRVLVAGTITHPFMATTGFNVGSVPHDLLAGSNFDDDRMGGIEKKWRSEYRREYLQKSIIEAKSTLATGVRSECVQFLA